MDHSTLVHAGTCIVLKKYKDDVVHIINAEKHNITGIILICNSNSHMHIYYSSTQSNKLKSKNAIHMQKNRHNFNCRAIAIKYLLHQGTNI